MFFEGGGEGTEGRGGLFGVGGVHRWREREGYLDNLKARHRGGGVLLSCVSCGNRMLRTHYLTLLVGVFLNGGPVVVRTYIRR